MPAQGDPTEVKYPKSDYPTDYFVTSVNKDLQQVFQNFLFAFRTRTTHLKFNSGDRYTKQLHTTKQFVNTEQLMSLLFIFTHHSWLVLLNYLKKYQQ